MAPIATDPSEAFSHLSVSEDLVPSRTEQQSQIVTLNFKGLLDPPLKLQTDVSECGGQLWPAGMVLAEYLLRNKMDELRGKTIVELGAGSGLTGLALSLGLSRTTNISNTIHLTDGHPPLLPLLRQNIALNTPHIRPTSLILPSLLSWGADLPPGIPKEPDIILAADCVYFEPAFPLLLNTMQELIGSETVCYFCFKKRRRADKDMVRLLEKEFDVEEIRGSWEKEVGVKLYRVRMEEDDSE
ncbi:hypothetical protein N7G274_004781 [Stereocaulon virgatum]|uniref:Elongation factor methyltransferase 6 n=1 Tax=Stereocaulon virgatum TaxID=373712 RepID=A0ABR4AFY1_9LECA